MSDDSYIPSGAGSPDDALGDGIPSFRLAIVSRKEGRADALWSVLDHRSRSRNRPPQTHASRADADIIVYLPSAEDFASESAAQSLEADIARDTAQKKIVFEPAPLSELGAQEHMIHLRDRLSVRDTIEWVAARAATESRDTDERSTRHDDILRNQARQVERLLKGKPSRSKVAVAPVVDKAEKPRPRRENPLKEGSEGREKKREAQRETRGKKKGERLHLQRTRESSLAAKRDAEPTEKGQRTRAKSVETNGKTPNKKPAETAVVLPANFRGKIPNPAEKPVALPAISIAINGLSEEEKAALMESLRSAFRESGVHAREAKPSSMSHVSVHAFDTHPLDGNEIERHARAILASKARLRILLDRTAFRVAKEAEKTEPENPAVAQTSLLCRGALLDLNAVFRRHGVEAANTEQRAAGHELTAALIVREAASLPGVAISRKPLTPAPDLVDAYRLADSPSELLSNLSWSAPGLPKVLHAHYARSDVENFVDRKIVLSEQDVRDFSAPIDWRSPVADRRGAAQLFGLEFLLAPLSYWYSKASDRKGQQLDEIDASLKQRGVTASAILASTGEVILDFLEKMPPQASSAAWQEDLISTRIRALIFHVLCCKLAGKRHIKFDEAACGAIFRGLVDHIEFLRSEFVYPLAAAEGVERDCFLAGAGLAMQQTDYGNVLLRESLERLRKRQLDIGLSGDGVWRNAPFAAHCAVLSALTVLLGDLAVAGSNAVEPIADAARKMTLFVDAMLKSNGESLPIDSTPARSYASALSGARRVLALVGARPAKGKPSKGMAASRITDTYVFRDAQYFVSHSTPKVTPESSQVAFHAEAGFPSKGAAGGLTLAFAYGPSSLILGQVSRRKELAGLANLRIWDPALRNGYHMDVSGDATKDVFQHTRASIVKSWRGPGWAAARGVESYPQAELARTIVHLKALHALLVVDEIASTTGGDTEFGQFWHVAPNLVPPENIGGVFQFGVPEGGFLTIAFDGRPDVSVDRDALSSCVRRSARFAPGVMASLFQWTTLGAAIDLSLLRGDRDNWLVSVSGAGAISRVSLVSNDLRVEESPQ